MAIGTSCGSVVYWGLESGEVIFYKGVEEYTWKENPAVLMNDEGKIKSIVLKEAQA